MYLRILFAASAIGLTYDAKAGETFVPFPVDWAVEADSPADLSFLLDGPAGEHGQVRIAEGHLARGDGKRLRLWGVNITMEACLPPKEHAPRIARRLAQSGVNCVRFHGLDSQPPRGVLEPGRNGPAALSPAQLDCLDFFIAELKHRGIYSNLNLNVFRRYGERDGVRDHELVGLGKGLTYFDPRLVELQKEYARNLLAHRNPYTGSEYRREPCVAIVELVNENSLVESWIAGRLLGKHTTKNPGTWSDIPASYERSLTELYNTWLSRRLANKELAELRTEAGVGGGELVPRLTPGQFAKASKRRFQTEAAFYMETERDYFRAMEKFLREELGIKALLVGSSDHNHYHSGYPHLASTSLLDIVDGHVYWQHPEYITKDGKRSGFRIPNTPMVDNPAASTIVQLARSAVAGKPYTVSEAGHPFPHESACEGIPILAAYAAFHDWDGIFLYTLGHKDPVANSRIGVGHFDLYPDPVKMAQLRVGALLFLRRDVSPARRTLVRSFAGEQVIESLRLARSERPLYSPGMNPLTPLAHSIRIASFDDITKTDSTQVAADPFRTDTGELAWHDKTKGDGAVTIETARSQAIIGHVKTAAKSTSNLAIQTDLPFCAVTLHSLGDQSITKSRTLLLTACARVANSGMQWDADRKTLEKWGTSPVLIEPVTGTVTLRGLDAAKSVTIQPLDAAGQMLGAAIAADKSGSGWSVLIGKPATTWYVIRIER